MSIAFVVNGNCFLNGSHFERADIVIKDGVIERIICKEQECKQLIDINGMVDESECEIIDATGCFVIPGFIDIHLHGAVGYDFCTATETGMQAIAEYEQGCGITSFCPTTMTLAPDALEQIFLKLGNFVSKNDKQTPGINMEGPFIAEEKAGAQNKQYICSPDPDLMEQLYNTSGETIRLVTIAPETQGAQAFVKRWRDRVHISLGHTAADYDCAKEAFVLGADHVTHLYNGMQLGTHRNPGVRTAAAEHEDTFVELICDLQHIHPAVIRETFALFGADRVVAISDSCEATGMDDGEYELGGQKIVKRGNQAQLEDGTLAGSVCNLFDAFLNLVKIGVPLETSVKACTVNPATSIGMEQSIGVIKERAVGNLLLLNQQLALQKIVTEVFK